MLLGQSDENSLSAAGLSDTEGSSEAAFSCNFFLNGIDNPVANVGVGRWAGTGRDVGRLRTQIAACRIYEYF